MTVPKREIRIILPLNDNGGDPLTEEHVELQAILSLNYGGFTRTIGQGGWYNDGSVVSEDIAVYDVAVPDDQKTYEHLVGLARMLCIRARQEAVYLRWTTGHVRLVTADVIDGKPICTDDELTKPTTDQSIDKANWTSPTLGQAVNKAVESLNDPPKNLSPLAQALSVLADMTADKPIPRGKITGLRKDCPSAPDACEMCKFDSYCR